MVKTIIKQHDITDCRANFLASVSAYYIPIARIRQYAGTDKGTNVLGLMKPQKN